MYFVSNSKAIIYDEIDVLSMHGFKYMFILEETWRSSGAIHLMLWMKTLRPREPSDPSKVHN